MLQYKGTNRLKQTSIDLWSHFSKQLLEYMILDKSLQVDGKKLYIKVLQMFIRQCLVMEPKISTIQVLKRTNDLIYEYAYMSKEENLLKKSMIYCI